MKWFKSSFTLLSFIFYKRFMCFSLWSDWSRRYFNWPPVCHWLPAAAAWTALLSRSVSTHWSCSSAIYSTSQQFYDPSNSVKDVFLQQLKVCSTQTGRYRSFLRNWFDWCSHADHVTDELWLDKTGDKLKFVVNEQLHQDDRETKRICFISRCDTSGCRSFIFRPD